MMKNEFLLNLLSRKFLLTVAGTAYFLSTGDKELAMILVAGYLAAEGLGDVAGRLNLNGNGKPKDGD